MFPPAALFTAFGTQPRLGARGGLPGVCSSLTASELSLSPAQAPERVERTPSPDTREVAGASSGESNTQKVSLHEGLPRHEAKISEPADPQGLAPSRGSGRGETAEKVTAGKDGKHGKLPRPEGTTPCPRCDSTDTKFCYYNNYNVKQPRYFCKVGRYSRCSSPRVCTLPTVAP